MKQILWIIIIHIIVNIDAYSAVNSYIAHTESGTTSVSTPDYSTPSVIYEHYIIVYKKKFIYPPKVIFGLHTFQNCPGQNNQYIHSFNANRSSITQFLFKSYILHNIYTDTNYKLIFNYFVADTSSNLYLQIKQGYFDATIPTPSFNIITFSKSGIDQPQVYTKCFASSIYCHTINTLPFIFQNVCTAISSTQLELEFNSNTVSAGCLKFPTAYWAIAIHPHISAQFYHGTLITIPPSFPTVSLNINTPSSIYFIGFTTFSATSYCLKLSLKSNNVQVDPSSSILSIQYEYFFIKQTFISLIKSYPFYNKLQMNFQQTNGFSPQVTSIIYNSSLQSIIYISNILYSNIISPITYYHIKMSFTMNNSLSQTFTLQFSFKIITIDYITISTFSNIVTISIKNIEQSLESNSFTINDSSLIIQSIDDLRNQTVLLNIQYEKKNTEQKGFSLKYKDSKQNSKSQMIFMIPKIIKTQSSCHSAWITKTILNIPGSSASSVNWDSQNIQSSSFISYNNNKSLQIKFEYLPSVQSSILIFNCEPNTLTKFRAHFSTLLITVKSMQITRNSNQIILTFININVISSINDFQTDLTGLTIKYLMNNNQLVLEYGSSGYNRSFIITYSSSQHQHQAIVTDLIIAQRVKSITVDKFNHWLNITLINVQKVAILPLITYSHPQLVFNTSSINNDQIQVSNKYNSTIYGGKLTLNYEINSSTIYYEIINIDLITDDNSLIVYCIDPFQNNRSRLEIMANVLVAIYWIIMVIGTFCCQKIYAIETMFALQFMYMSLIPIGIYCPPFDILKNLQYSFGWNGIFSSLIETTINVNYQVLGINSNFLSNVNFMIILILACPVVYLILTTIGKYTTHYRTQPRLLTYGKTFLLDVPFTLVLINTPNICISFIVNFQAFNILNIISFIFSSIMLVLILLTVILFCVFKSSFRQFKMQFCEKKQICNISVQKSTSIRRLYPIIILLEMITISSVISTENLMKISLYICLGIMAFVTFILLIIAPYINKIDNIRLFIHRFLLLLLCGLEIGFFQLRHDYAQRTSFVYDYPWLPLATLTIISCVINFPYIIYKSILWFKRRGIIDMQLYTKQTSRISITKRSYYPKKTTGLNQTYPALQHSRFEKGIQCLIPSTINPTITKPIQWQQMNLPPEQQS